VLEIKCPFTLADKSGKDGWKYLDLEVGKPVKRTVVGFTLCGEEYKLEISETDLWSSLLVSYFSLKSTFKSTASILAHEKLTYRELDDISKYDLKC
jgi:hypothetical protein